MKGEKLVKFRVNKEQERNEETSISSRFSVGLTSDITNPSGKDYMTGDSINEHQIIEQANEYIAEEEVNQQYNNL
ncbi:hypothetical protein [Calidifontibacillus oryziterrae]|uniref:hypothetical protein n=1 Tax=Calidifontibacillus oryziterrae TaxID=1191699 RepID=UPI0002EC764E|nr:hypothetical protein [Calidifontibacillus oryziterrae]